MVNILTTSKKIQKGEKQGWLTAICYLSPANESEKNLCPWHTEAYAAACLGHSSGRLALPFAKRNRMKRSELFLKNRTRFYSQLRSEIDTHLEVSELKDFKPAFRLNGSSDIPWESVFPDLFKEYSSVQFYDYTKSFKRMLSFCGDELPLNYHLTYSRSEVVKDWNQSEEILSIGGNVAVVFDRIPNNYQGYSVVDGEANDLRFLDKKGVVVGLKAKGAALKDELGFVVKTKKLHRSVA